MFFCEWSVSASSCGLPTIVWTEIFTTKIDNERQVQGIGGRSWVSICSDGYVSRDDLLLVIHTLDMFPGEWMAECVTGFSSTTWGLMSEQQVIDWFKGGNGQTWDGPIDPFVQLIQVQELQLRVTTHVAPHTIRRLRAPPPPHAYDPLPLLSVPARAS